MASMLEMSCTTAYLQGASSKQYCKYQALHTTHQEGMMQITLQLVLANNASFCMQMLWMLQLNGVQEV